MVYKYCRGLISGKELSLSDEKILKLLKKHDEKALIEIAEKYEKLLKYIVSNILGDRTQDIEECLNDTYYKIWKNSHRYDFAKASLKTYLKVIARNTALNRIRDLNRNDQMIHKAEFGSLLENYADYCQNPEHKAISREKLKVLEEIMQDLNKKDYELLLRKYFYFQSSKDISEKMEMSINAIDTKLSRIRGKIKEEFERRVINE